MWWNRKSDNNKLTELNRKNASLVNAHTHHDLKKMSELEKLLALRASKEELEQEKLFEDIPWLKKVSRAIRKSIFK